MLDTLKRWLASLTKRRELTLDSEAYFRQGVIDAASIAENLSAGQNDTLEAFRRILGEPPSGVQWDLDRPFRIVNNPDGTLHHTEGVSTCGLGARGISFQTGIPWPEFMRPYDYIRESVFAVMQGHARRFGGLRKGLPLPGDHFIIGSGYQTHMGTAIDVRGDFVTSVDAGQTDMRPSPGRRAGLQCFKLITRDWRKVTPVCVLDTYKIFQGFSQER